MKSLRYYPGGQEAVWKPTVTVEQLFTWFCCALLFLSITVGQLRFLSYSIPLVALIVCLAVGRFRLPEMVWPFAVLVVFAVATAPLATQRGWQDVYLMLIGITPFAIGLKLRVSWRSMFIVAIAGMALSYAMRRLTGGNGGGVEFDLMNSTSPLESPFSFLFGMLAVWAAAERRWKAFLLALVMTTLTLKRIALLGALLCFAVAVLPVRWRNLLVNPVTMVVVNLTVVALAVLYGSGAFDRTIYEWTGQSANQFGMGRRYAFAFPAREISEHFERYLFLGAGPGQIYEVMKGGFSWLGKKNLHCDLLKILLEYGAVAFVAFSVFAFRMKSAGQRLLWTYFNVLLMTDNALIYPWLVFSMCLCGLSLRDPERQPASAALSA